MMHEHEYEDNSSGPKAYRIKLTVDLGKNVECYYLKSIFARSNTADPEAVNLVGIDQYKFVWTPNKKEALPLSSDRSKEIAAELSSAKKENRRYTVTHE